MPSAPVYTIKEGDTRPIRAYLRDVSGTAINLAGCTVLFNADQVDGVRFVIAVASVLSAPEGLVAYTPGPTSLAAGLYRVEFEVTFADLSVLTVPNDGYRDLRVLADLN